jgi:hypothetical protein
MIPGWHAENQRNAAARQDLGSRIRIWVTGSFGAGWQCESCGGYETFTGARATQETVLAGAGAHWCPPRETGETVTSSWNPEHMAGLAALQDTVRAASASVNDLRRAAGITCTCRAPHSDDPLAHPHGCPRRTELAAEQGRLACPGCGFVFDGRMTAACTCQHCGHRFPAQDTAGTPLTRYGSRQADGPHREKSGQPCWGPHPPGVPWPCGCTPLSRHGSLAGIPDPVPPAPRAAYSWPNPLPGVPRTCAGCGLGDHMPYPAGPGALCSYCEERWQAAPRALTAGDWLFTPDAGLPAADPDGGLARWPRPRDLLPVHPLTLNPAPGRLVPVLAVAVVVLIALGAYTPAAIGIIILAVLAVFRR